MERENRQRGLRLWSKTNRTFGKGDVQQILFGAAYHIPCRIPTDSIKNQKVDLNENNGGTNRRKNEYSKLVFGADYMRYVINMASI